jgi:hypothetical protein
MKPFRRRLRLAVAAWLLFQVVSLSALVPRDCCDAHHAATAEGTRCHEDADSAYCPMRSQGRNCPMHPQVPAAHPAESHAHHGGGGHHQDAAAPAPADHASHGPAGPESPSRDECTLRGTCSAPANALAVILSNHGVVPAATLAPGNADRAPAPLPPDEHLTSRLVAPDSPPPRA